MIGSLALKAELERVGLRLVDGKVGRQAELVAVGGHVGFNYEELRIASQAVRRGAPLYAAGRDATFPMPDGPWPATGAILAAVETAAGAKATVVGKPEGYIFEIARSLLPGRRRIAIVGDNLGSDIVGGKRAGLTTILVLTGTTSRQDLEVLANSNTVMRSAQAGGFSHCWEQTGETLRHELPGLDSRHAGLPEVRRRELGSSSVLSDLRRAARSL